MDRYPIFTDVLQKLSQNIVVLICCTGQFIFVLLIVERVLSERHHPIYS
jgi:hypothetical protein